MATHIQVYMREKPEHTEKKCGTRRKPPSISATIVTFFIELLSTYIESMSYKLATRPAKLGVSQYVPQYNWPRAFYKDAETPCNLPVALIAGTREYSASA